jgi:hypothetical protein
MSTKRTWNFDPKTIHFRQPSFNNKGQRIVEMSLDPVSLKWNDRLRMQICNDLNMCVAMYNLSTPKEGQGDGSRRDWKLIMHHSEAVDSLKNLEKHIINVAFENRKEWFPRKDLTFEQIEEKFAGLFKEKEGESSNSVQVKVKCPGSNSVTEIKLLEDGKMTPGTIDDLTRNSEVIPIVSISNVWFMMEGAKFGVTLAAEKLLVKPAKKMTFIESFQLSKPLVFKDETDVMEE